MAERATTSSLTSRALVYITSCEMTKLKVGCQVDMELSLKNSCYVNADLCDNADESQAFEGIRISSDRAVDEVDFARVLSPRLLGLDFSKIEVSHEDEACKKIKRAVTNMGRCHYNLISVSSSHCYKSLLAALEPEPEDEKELFWQKVRWDFNQVNCITG